ncbi:MAG: hypothetical protein H7Y10_14875 [Flavobacterium sp.]|nr:hypothetical protein [Flavobacterium sp.]
MTKSIKIEHLKKIVENEFLNITKYLIPGEIDKLSLGTAGLFLNSIFEHLHSLNLLLDLGLIESAASVSTSLWERSITLQYIMTNHIEFTKAHAKHDKVKKTPWNIKQMVNGIIDFENHKVRNPEIEKDLLYMQYTYLCAIKHGSPFTMTYLNRIEKDNNTVIGLKPNFTKQDEDLKNYLLLLSITTAFEGILKFSKVFCKKEKNEQLARLNRKITQTIIKDLNLDVPQIIYSDEKEFKTDFWEYLQNLDKNGN